MPETRKTVCSRDCPDACSIEATIDDNGKVVSLRGDKSHPLTRGFLCYRTTLFPALQNSPDRLMTPLLRGSDGQFHPISWDEALDLCAEKLSTVKKESGAAAIFHYRSGGSLGALKHLCDYFFEQFGPVTIKRGDICSGAGDAAQVIDFGDEDSNDVFDLLNSRHILLWGKNVSVSSPHLVPVLQEAAKSGTELVQIDPVYQKTASLVTKYLQPRPAADFALAMAVARLLFENNWIDKDAAKYCDNLDEFRALCCGHSIEEWCRQADVSVDDALDLARRLGAEKPTAILVGWGMGRRRNGGAIVRALDALCAISGNIGIPGGGVSFYFKRRGGFDFSFIKGADAAPRTVCEPLFGKEVLAASDPPIRAIWVTAGNPVAMLPESDTIVEALKSREFVVVVDSFMTDTARLAHLVLPTTTLLEADDLLGAYGHHWIGVATPVVAPPADIRSDLEIMQGLAERVGLTDKMSATARQWKQRILSSKLTDLGITLEKLEADGPQRNPLAPKILFADRKFPTETGRVNLITEAPPAPQQAEVSKTEYPLQLMALSTEKAQSSQWSVPQEGYAEVVVHPNAAGGIADGATGLLESCVGSMTVRVKHDARQREDVLLMPKGGHWHAGRCANSLVRAATTDIGEGGALYDEPVRLVALAVAP